MTMQLTRRSAMFMTAAALSTSTVRMAQAEPTVKAEDVIIAWYKLVLELVRHTPTYSPPVASRSFAYVGVAVYEALASGSSSLRTLAGQLNGLKPLAAREPGQQYDNAVILNAVLARAVTESGLKFPARNLCHPAMPIIAALSVP